MPQRIVHDLLPSTQEEAIRLARDGAEAGTSVLARRQSRGRGRLDHTWASAPGGLYLSRIVREPPLEPGLLSIAVGAFLARGLEARFGVQTQMKWPNDLLVLRSGQRPRKLAGILIDRIPSPTLGTSLVVGIGLNVTNAREGFSPELQDRVAILGELVSGPVDLREVEQVAEIAIEEATRALETPEGHANVLAEGRSLLYGVGRAARVDGRPAGIIRELGPDGTLWLDHNGERVGVRAGDMTVEEST